MGVEDGPSPIVDPVVARQVFLLLFCSLFALLLGLGDSSCEVLIVFFFGLKHNCLLKLTSHKLCE